MTEGSLLARLKKLKDGTQETIDIIDAGHYDTSFGYGRRKEAKETMLRILDVEKAVVGVVDQIKKLKQRKATYVLPTKTVSWNQGYSSGYHVALDEVLALLEEGEPKDD